MYSVILYVVVSRPPGADSLRDMENASKCHNRLTRRRRLLCTTIAGREPTNAVDALLASCVAGKNEEVMSRCACICSQPYVLCPRCCLLFLAVGGGEASNSKRDVSVLSLWDLPPARLPPVPSTTAPIHRRHRSGAARRQEAAAWRCGGEPCRPSQPVLLRPTRPCSHHTRALPASAGPYEYLLRVERRGCLGNASWRWCGWGCFPLQACPVLWMQRTSLASDRYQ